MGRLVEYFQNLKSGDKIDDEIVDALFSPIIPPVTGDIKKREALIEILPVQIPKYNAVYLPWIDGSVSVVKADVGQDVISWPFSGCWMARIHTTMGFNECYHIHTGGDNDKKNFWNTEFIPFIGNHPQYNTNTGKLFRPKSDMENKILGIISACGMCLSVSISKDWNNWIKNEITLCKSMDSMTIVNY